MRKSKINAPVNRNSFDQQEKEKETVAPLRSTVMPSTAVQEEPLIKQQQVQKKVQKQNVEHQPTKTKKPLIEDNQFKPPEQFEQVTMLFENAQSLNITDYILKEKFGKLRIYQNEKDKRLLKAFMHIPFQLSEIIGLFFNAPSIKHWNSQVEEMKIKQIVQNQMALIQMRLKPYWYLYFQREFYITRRIFSNKAGFVILDQPWDNKDELQSFWQTKGNIIEQSIALITHPKIKGFTLCAITCNFKNNGWITATQDAEMTLKYLKEYASINDYLIQQSFTNQLQSYQFQAIQLENELPSLFSELNESAFFSMYQNKQQVQISKIQKNDSLMEAFDEKDLSFEEEEKQLYEELETFETKVDRMLEQAPDTNFDLNQEEIIRSVNRKINWTENQIEYMLDLTQTGEACHKAIRTKFQLEQVVPEQPIMQEMIDGEHYAIPESSWQKNPKGGLVFIDQVNINSQKQVAKILIKQIGKNLLTGKSLIDVSMPVIIFGDTSVLGRFAEAFVFAPNYLEKAGTIDDPLEQFKLALAYNTSVLHFGIHQAKPFNPILGETYQAFVNGAPIYLEQISRFIFIIINQCIDHPPISAFQLYGEKYNMDGRWEFTANMHANSISGYQLGFAKVFFPNTKAEIYLSRPPMEITGILWGQRLLNYYNKAVIFDLKNMLFCEIQFNLDRSNSIFSKPVHKNDYFEGNIYKIKQSFADKLAKMIKQQKNYKDLQNILNVRSDIAQVVCEVKGVWHEYLEIGGQVYWNFSKDTAHQILHEKNPLPSDSIYRKDLIIWQSRDVEKAQEAKVELENLQRADRKLRANFEKKQKKK